MMTILTFYFPIAVSTVSLIALARIAILWHRCVESLNSMRQSGQANADLHFNFNMQAAIREAEAVDERLASSMRSLARSQIIAFLCFISFGLFALVFGSQML